MELNENSVDRNPIVQFGKWFQFACDNGVKEANAMTLSTVGTNQRPSSRVVLMKDYTMQGITFFTNYNSRKAHEIERNKGACLNYFWKELFLQVNIEGVLTKVSSFISDEYFATRPRESQIGAWASDQSHWIESREYLESRILHFTKEFENRAVPRPDNWGGYLLIPDRFEFWIGRESRLHDRITYQYGNGLWNIARLSP